MQSSQSASIATIHQPQAWLSTPWWDVALIIAPAFLSSAIALVFKQQLEANSNLPLWAWVGFVLLVDVAHVYASLFRTYLNREAFERNKVLLLIVPAVCWIFGSLLYSVDGLLFWKALAYLAVFHFIRQQYGFMVIYSRKDPPAFSRFRSLDGALIYMATLYPILYWHTHMPRHFDWFVAGDFIENLPSFVSQAALAVYLVMAMLYMVKELTLLKTTGFLNIPRNLLILGTALSWSVGIVLLNSDMAFTMTNVLSHGIPYMALVWLYQNRKSVPGTPTKHSNWFNSSFLTNLALRNAFIFVVFLVLLAYLEEGLWDGLIWREHLQVFLPFSHLPAVSDSALLALLIPLLALPQSTHYVLDGFIWRVKDKNSNWSVQSLDFVRAHR